MPDPNPLEQLQSYIFNQNNPNINQELRRRIALQMLATKRAFPKNTGEGLSAIGEAIGDRSTLSQLAAAEGRSEAAGRSAEERVVGAPAAARPASVASGVEPLPPERTAPAEPPPLAKTALYGGSDPSGLLSAELPTSLGGTTGAPGDPASAYLSPNRMGTAPPARPPVQAAATGAGTSLAPAYMRAPIERNINNPEMRHYASVMTGKEAKNANDVSSTGAAGPFQFVPGTARQYGLTDPTNLDASTNAFKRFTQSNAADFEIENQRPPTMADLAVMHQQGPLTGARMIAGTGNASARNLALNNVPGNSSPADAVARIKKYYGLPEADIDVSDRPATSGGEATAFAPEGSTEAPTGLPPEINARRDSIANALRPAQGVPQGNPIVPGAVPPMPAGLNPSLPPGGSPVSGSPPVMAQGADPITRAPPPPGDQPYTMEKPRDPTPPPTLPLRQKEVEIMQILRETPPADRDAVAARLAPYMQREQAIREREQAQLDAKYKDTLTHNRALDLKREDQLEKAPETRIKIQKAPAEIAKLKAEAADLEAKAKAGRVPVTREINDVTQQFDPVTQSWIVPPGTGGNAATINMTEAQSKDLATYRRGRRSLYNLGTGDMLHNWTDWYISGVPLVGTAMSDPKFQTQYNAAEEFANIALRKETGQGATIPEIASVIRRYIPKPGSSPELIEQMRLAREEVIASTRAALGKATPKADEFDRTFAEEVKRVTELRAAALKEGKTLDQKSAVELLPPVVIRSKDEKDALPRGRRYRLPSDGPDVIRKKTSHD